MGFGSPKESTEWLSLISKGVSSGFSNRHERGILLRTQAALPFEAPKHVVWVIDFSKNIPSGKNRGGGRCGRVPVRRDPSPSFKMIWLLGLDRIILSMKSERSQRNRYFSVEFSHWCRIVLLDLYVLTDHIVLDDLVHRKLVLTI